MNFSKICNILLGIGILCLTYYDIPKIIGGAIIGFYIGHNLVMVFVKEDK